MKVNTVAALLVGLFLFASQEVPGRAFEVREIMKMAPEVISMLIQAATTCMKENNMSLMKTGASLITTKGLDQNAKCTACCLTSQIMLTDGDECSVNTGFINLVVEGLPATVKDLVQKMTSKCESAAAGKSKCQGLFNYVTCIFKEGKNNLGSIMKIG